VLAKWGACRQRFGDRNVANPDLVERCTHANPLAAPDPFTLHGGGAAGYTDYPAARSAARA